MTNLEDILTHFKISSRHDNKIQAFCPAHDDKNASLSILLSERKILLYCHAGCQVEDILKAVNLTFSNLFLDTKPPTAIYQYRNADNSLHHEKLRYPTTKGKRFTQRQVKEGEIVDNLEGTNRIPYNYPQVLEAIKKGKTILYVEGEKDADNAKLLNYTATTMGSASDWKDEYKYYFKNAIMVLIPDKDKAGFEQTKNIENSLVGICKSLKIINLPSGKDLTEWIENGNSDLKSLIVNSPEIIQYKGLPEPSMELTVSGYTFDWNGLNLKVALDHIKGDDEGEISVFDNGRLVYISGIRLLSISHKTALARVLRKQRNIDWDSILTTITTKSLSHIRAGESIVWLDEEYNYKRPEYLLHPLFVKNAANIIYADKSSAKSLFMTLIDIILTLPWSDNDLGLNISPSDRHNVLFLDWENDANITGWQKQRIIKGMNIEWCDIPYLHCSRPLVDSIEHIKDKINKLKSDVIIIDSLGMAVGDDLNLTKPAFTFYSALRQLPVTPIIIAHTSKDISSRRKTVYGNAYYENEARSVWEVVKDQQPGENELTISLYQRKSPPFAPYHEPLGWAFYFEEDNIIVKRATPEIDNRNQIEERTLEDKIINVLKDTEQHLKPAEIMYKMKENKEVFKESSVNTTLKRMKNKQEPDIGQDNNGGYFYKL